VLPVHIPIQSNTSSSTTYPGKLVHFSSVHEHISGPAWSGEFCATTKLMKHIPDTNFLLASSEFFLSRLTILITITITLKTLAIIQLFSRYGIPYLITMLIIMRFMVKDRLRSKNKNWLKNEKWKNALNLS